jgi:ABC-2 type transport system permease protein
MTRLGRLRAEFGVAYRSFLRRRTAVFFTFLFPTILVVIFGALVRTNPGDGGLFAEPASFYVPGYLATVVLFTPLSRMSSEVARHREGNRFEKLASTPLRRSEWLGAHVAVNVAIVGVAAALILGLVLALTGAPLGNVWALPIFLVPGIVAFCSFGTILGRLTDSRDGAVAASNTIGLPLLFLSNTFVAPDQLPGWFQPLIELSPLTYFARGTRHALYGGGSPWLDLGVLAAMAIGTFVIAAYAIPQTD